MSIAKKKILIGGGGRLPLIICSSSKLSVKWRHKLLLFLDFGISVSCFIYPHNVVIFSGSRGCAWVAKNTFWIFSFHLQSKGEGWAQHENLVNVLMFFPQMEAHLQLTIWAYKQLPGFVSVNYKNIGKCLQAPTHAHKRAHEINDIYLPLSNCYSMDSVDTWPAMWLAT